MQESTAHLAPPPATFRNVTAYFCLANLFLYCFFLFKKKEGGKKRKETKIVAQAVTNQLDYVQGLHPACFRSGTKSFFKRLICIIASMQLFT